MTDDPFRTAPKLKKKQLLSPLHDWVLAEYLAPESVTSSGLHIPEKYLEKNALETYRVLKVGPGRIGETGEVIKMPVKEGDIVCFNAAQGPYTFIPGATPKQVLARAECILGTVETIMVPDETSSIEVVDDTRKSLEIIKC